MVRAQLERVDTHFRQVPWTIQTHGADVGREGWMNLAGNPAATPSP
ncbi:MAG: hypothetical protein HW416_2309, partial [Chloroflexi bacterium]|nr:hypothetical protein [Chloroflexota bacterium]